MKKTNKVYGNSKKKSINKSTNKKSKKNNETIQNNEFIITTFLELLNMIKLFHWQTHSYSQHIATDDLFKKLNSNIDKFVEVLLGKYNTRIHFIKTQFKLLDIKTSKTFIEKIHKYREFFIKLDEHFKTSTDLLTIRDEILVDINQFLFLMSLN